MKVKRIIVDQLKRCCSECELGFYTDFKIGKFICYPLKREIPNGNEVPEWCPLEVEQECKWWLDWEMWDDYEGGKEGFPILRTECDWEYTQWMDDFVPEQETIKKMVASMDFTFCPNCSKRIKYAEE